MLHGLGGLLCVEERSRKNALFLETMTVGNTKEIGRCCGTGWFRPRYFKWMAVKADENAGLGGPIQAAWIGEPDTG